MYKDIDEDLAEIIGILMGDGNIYHNNEKWQYQLDISLNQIDEPRYFLHVKNLFEFKFQKNIKTCNQTGKAVSLRYYSKDINQFLIEIGLIPGSKSQNQISIPKIIKQETPLITKCLKGLFDTDGSITIDNDKDLRLTFTNCSKPLVTDFYNLCLKIGIIPSPKIQYNKNRKAWRVMIARKDEITKFFKIVNPEKIKEPYRRYWMALKILYFKSVKDTQYKMRSKIEEWLKQNNQTQFKYSKQNTDFFKELIEHFLKFRLDPDNVNKILTDVLELEKIMYTTETAQRFKYLYENLRSSERIVEFLIDQSETVIPHRQTITKHLKRYFVETNQYIESWQKNNPKYRIGLDENNFIRVFPNELRNEIVSLIIRILLEHRNEITPMYVLQELKQNIDINEILIMNWLLKSPKYSSPIENYLKVLIILCRHLVDVSQNGNYLNITKISKNPKVPLNRTTLIKITNFIIRNKILSLKK